MLNRISDVVKRLSGMLPLLSCKKKKLIADSYANKVADAFVKIIAGQNADAELKNIIALVPYMDVSFINGTKITDDGFVSIVDISCLHEHWFSLKFVVI